MGFVKVSGCKVLKATEALDAIISVLPRPCAGPRNSIYRGKFLGGTVTAAQYEAIASGAFDDLYIGDYWIINGVTYRIAAFDYYCNVGDTALTKHHAIIVPDLPLYNAAMNATNTTTGGYVGSLMRMANLEQAKTIIKAAFPGHVLQHRQLLTNAVIDGKASGWAWYDAEVELMNEIMTYGTSAWGRSATNNGYNTASNNGQLPLFTIRSDLMCNRKTWWLRDVVLDTAFALVSAYGSAEAAGAGSNFGVRPAFSVA